MSGSVGRRLSGVASITIDGIAYDVVGDLTWSPSTVKRETLAGQTRVEGFSEMPVAGYISATLRDGGGITVADFVGMTSSTVVVQQANGKTIYGAGMWCVDAIEVKTQDGTFSVKFEGDDVTEATV